MKSKRFVIVPINKNYRASVYDTDDLIRYVKNYPNEVDWDMIGIEDRPQPRPGHLPFPKDAEYDRFENAVRDTIEDLRKQYAPKSQSAPTEPVTAKSEPPSAPVRKQRALKANPDSSALFRTITEANEAFEKMVKEAGREIRRHDRDSVYIFRNRVLGWVDAEGNRGGRRGLDSYYQNKITRAGIEEILREHGDEVDEIFFEGRFDMFDSWQAYFERGGYDPTDEYVSLTIWKRNPKT